MGIPPNSDDATFITPMFSISLFSLTGLSGKRSRIMTAVARTAFVMVKGIWAKPACTIACQMSGQVGNENRGSVIPKDRRSARSPRHPMIAIPSTMTTTAAGA